MIKTTQGVEPASLCPNQQRAMESIQRTSAAGRPTRLAASTLCPLIDRGWIYAVSFPDRTFAHLTKKGAERLGVDPGNRK